MGRKKKTDEERQQAAGKWLRRLDPSAEARQPSAMDLADGAAGRMREARREWDSLRALEELVDEQKETNRLLRRLVGDEPMPPPSV